jgi:hypothetical protein
MSAPNPLITPRTAAQTVQFGDGQHGDKVILYITGAWGIAEDASVNVPTTAGGITPVLDSLGNPIVVGVTRGYVELDGGFLYTIVKGNTLNPAGIDFQVKPRIGPH